MGREKRDQKEERETRGERDQNEERETRGERERKKRGMRIGKEGLTRAGIILQAYL